MSWVQHTFQGINSDVDPRLLEPSLMRDALNIRYHTGENGFAGALQSALGNRKVSDYYQWGGSSWVSATPSGEYQPITCFEDKASEAIYILLWSAQSNHIIARYEEKTAQTKILIQSPLLKFRANGCAQGGVIGRTLLFTDGQNAPRAIDVDTIYKVSAPREAMISMPRPRPSLPPTALGFEDDGIHRFDRQSLVFSYRFVFKDGTASVWSDYSRLVNTWFDNGNNVLARKITRVSLSFQDSITQDTSGAGGTNAWIPLIDKVEVACRIGQQTGISEAQENVTNPFRLIARSDFPLTSLDFRNDQNYDTVDSAQISKGFDSAPIRANAMVAVRNRVLCSGLTEGYDIPGLSFQRQADPKIVASGSISSALTVPVLKSGAEYQFGIQFEDDYGRSSGVITRDSLRLNVPFWGPDGLRPFIGIKFIMYGQPPEWATSYSVVRTNTLNKSSWLQFAVYDKGYSSTKRFGIQEAKWYSDDALENEVSGPEHEDADFIGLPIAYRLKAGFGYDALQGDKVAIQGYGDPSAELDVVGLVGSRIVARWDQEIDIDNFLTGYSSSGTPGTRVCEIFRPRKPSEVEPFYKIGVSYPVLNPGTPSRALSQPNIEIKHGDVYWTLEKYKPEFPALLFHENPTPVLSRPAQRDLEIGRATVVLRDAQQKFRPTAYRWSNPLIQESNINGVCSFDSADQEILPYEAGDAIGLALAANSQAEGTVVLGLHQNDTASIYTEQGIFQTGAGGVVSSNSSSFFSQFRILRSETGCQNPESIASEDGRVYWLDAASGSVCRYSQDGVEVISDRGMRRYFRDMTQVLRGLGANGRAVGGFDEYNREYILSIGGWKQTKSTVAFSESAGMWTSFYSFASEAYGKLSNRFFSMLGADLYKHDNPTPNEFFGSTYESQAQICCGYGAGVLLPQSLGLRSNMAPSRVDVETLEGQTSILLEDDFRFKENIHYAPFYRDSTTGLASGDRLRSEATLIRIRFTPTKALVMLAAAVRATVSSGHPGLR